MITFLSGRFEYDMVFFELSQEGSYQGQGYSVLRISCF